MKNFRLLLLLSTSLLLITACKEKKKKTQEEKIFPVLSFIKGQIAHIDTSMYVIMKITYIDTTRSDTAYYKREQFKDLAADFLSLPDLAQPEYEDRYTEQRSFDTTIDRAIYMYEAVKPEKELIQRQEVLIKLGEVTGDISTIIIDYFKNSKDSVVEKRMLWQADKSFQITTTRQLPGQPETIITYKVIWTTESEPDSEEKMGESKEEKK